MAPGAVERLTGLGVLAECGPAEAARCDACGRDHVEPVRWADGPGPVRRAYILCPDEGVVRVEPVALRRWVVRLPVLADLAAGAVVATGPVAEVVPGRAWRLGTVRAAGRAWPAFLLAGLTRPDAAGVVARLPGACSAAAVAFVPARVPPAAVWGARGVPPVVPLTDLLAVTPDGFAADRVVLESALTPVGRPVRPVAAPVRVPPGTQWEAVELAVGDHDLTVRVGGEARRVGYAEAGFADGRTGNPNAGWQHLRALARSGGVLGTGDRVTTKGGVLKQQVSELRKRLAALVGIEADPFHPADPGSPYRARFAVRSASAAVFPTPTGATWEDVTITEVGPWSVEVAVTGSGREVVTTGGADGRREAASVAVEHTARYTLADLGLVKASGQPNRAGAALVAVLRAGGRVARPGTEPGMLALGDALTRFLGIVGPPFTFQPGGRTWVANFEATSVVDPAGR